MISLRDKLGKPFSKLYKWLASFWNGTAAQEKIQGQSLLRYFVLQLFRSRFVYTRLLHGFLQPHTGPDGIAVISALTLFQAPFSLVPVQWEWRCMFFAAYTNWILISPMHFDKMGKITVMLALLYLYFNVNEFLVPAFKMKKEEKDYLNGLFTGDYSVMFWFAIMVGMIIPVLVLIFKKGRKPLPMFIVGVMIVIGAWFKRYLIVTPTLLHPFLPKYDAPARFSHYFPSWEEWAITMGSMAGVLLIITFFVRVFPIISIYKTLEDKHEITKHNETA